MSYALSIACLKFAIDTTDEMTENGISVSGNFNASKFRLAEVRIASTWSPPSGRTSDPAAGRGHTLISSPAARVEAKRPEGRG